MLVPTLALRMTRVRSRFFSWARNLRSLTFRRRSMTAFFAAARSSTASLSRRSFSWSRISFTASCSRQPCIRHPRIATNTHSHTGATRTLCCIFAALMASRCSAVSRYLDGDADERVRVMPRHEPMASCWPPTFRSQSASSFPAHASPPPASCTCAQLLPASR